MLVENGGVHLRDELADRRNRYTIISHRDYRADALCTVALWSRGQPAAASLEDLRRPRLPLYLGRKSCPLALPLAPRLVSAAALDAAFGAWLASDDPRQAEFLRNTCLDRLSRERECYWEGDGATVDPARLSPLHTTVRRDRPHSRQRWQFAERNEHYGRLKGE